MSPSMIAFCKVFWKTHVFYVLQGEVDLGANKNIHAVGQGMQRGKHVVDTWWSCVRDFVHVQLRGRCVEPFSCQSR